MHIVNQGERLVTNSGKPLLGPPASNLFLQRQPLSTFFFKFYFIFKLYNIVLVLPNIEMNPPQVYMCSPS